jgi:hypothetical protein
MVRVYILHVFIFIINYSILLLLFFRNQIAQLLLLFFRNQIAQWKNLSPSVQNDGNYCTLYTGSVSGVFPISRFLSFRKKPRFAKNFFNFPRKGIFCSKKLRKFLQSLNVMSRKCAKSENLKTFNMPFVFLAGR